MKRVAVVGSGISGLAAAHALAPFAQVTLYEADRRFGGHAHTVDVTLPDAAGRPVTHGVDTGFLVYNERTYPELVRLFASQGVDTAPAEMSFSVQSHADGLEWSGSNLDSVFAQRRNLARPRFLSMLASVLRFNRLATALAQQAPDRDLGPAGDAPAGAVATLGGLTTDPGLAEPIGDFLDRHGFNSDFRNWYLLPMVGCIWSCPTDQMLRFPIATLIRFCHNHGLLQVSGRPQWFTVRGGSARYVQKLLTGIADARASTPVRHLRRVPPALGHGGVMLATDHGSERFDEVVLACHSDQALALLDDASVAEQAVLGAIRYHPNEAVLHTDAGVLPRRRRAWASWNYARAADTAQEHAAVCLHYLINRLQPLPWPQPVVVSLNPDPACPPDPATVLGRYHYAHPVFDAAAIRAQRQLPAIQGHSHLWFCGAWTRYGFHEDGLMSAQAVVQQLMTRWQSEGTLRSAA